MLIKSSEIKITDEMVEIKPFVGENEICISDDASGSLAKESSPVFESDSEGFESDAVLSECEADEEQWEDRQLRAYRRTSFQE